MNVEKLELPADYQLVRCGALEATHFANGQPIIELSRIMNSKGTYFCAVGSSTISHASACVNLDGLCVHGLNYDRICHQNVQDTYALCKHVESTESQIQITLSMQEAGVLMSILGQFNHSSSSGCSPVLGTMGSPQEHLYQKLADFGNTPTHVVCGHWSTPVDGLHLEARK